MKLEWQTPVLEELDVKETANGSDFMSSDMIDFGS